MFIGPASYVGKEDASKYRKATLFEYTKSFRTKKKRAVQEYHIPFVHSKPSRDSSHDRVNRTHNLLLVLHSSISQTEKSVASN
jgi:hypothetical protein